ncbi:hypothetical protein [Mucilaginibacter arboris]|uniref:Uncharacterized protein n=1 Tax=Mucilaginibacter arboris TaxID=2682090 RepID=A0A7K1SW73_9SPHI|nr:hypothetical protein [Mucilaginibacter arboris]MVN21488.1 hypothetical protein [Mucilaginibacter arboris]
MPDRLRAVFNPARLGAYLADGSATLRKTKSSFSTTSSISIKEVFKNIVQQAK